MKTLFATLISEITNLAGSLTRLYCKQQALCDYLFSCTRINFEYFFGPVPIF